MSLSSVQHYFSQSFANSPTTIASAPGRVNVIGEHTDYNGGPVLPLGIAYRTYVAARPIERGSHSQVVSDAQPGRGTFDVTHPTRAGEWWDYVAGIAEMLARMGIVLPQVELAVVSSVPTGAGLSSSAALEVAAALALTAVARPSPVSSSPASPMDASLLDARTAATAAWRAETEFVGVPCGIMDQFASAMAVREHALLIECDTFDTALVPCRETILIFDTGVRRSLRHSAFTRRREECAEALTSLQRDTPNLHYLAHATERDIGRANLPDPLRKRALHVVRETERTRRVVAALRRGEPIPGDALTASHESLRTLYECSIPELDWFVDHAIRRPGIRGARLTGAGWGGCAIATGDRDALVEAAVALSHDYARAFVHAPRSWLTDAADGARLER